MLKPYISLLLRPRLLMHKSFIPLCVNINMDHSHIVFGKYVLFAKYICSIILYEQNILLHPVNELCNMFEFSSFILSKV